MAKKKIREAKEKSLKSVQEIDPYNFSRSSVNIIIPFHGQVSKVGRLVESIITVTRSNPYQICLVDDGTKYDDEERVDTPFLTQMEELIPTPNGCKPQIITVENEERMGFGAALQAGFDATEEPWVIFMHSDCVVKEANWMVDMGRTLMKLKRSGVKLVSARTNNPTGGHKELKASKGERVPDLVFEDGYVPLYCAMVHRELFQHIGGFIKHYPLGWYEDEELAHRMRHFEFKQAMCGRSWVYHEGGATLDRILKNEPEARKILEENRERCVKDMRFL